MIIVKLDSVIFDLDGVLVFSDKYHYLAWKRMADDMGIYFDEKINNRLRGVSRMASLEIILENYKGEPLSEEAKFELAERKNSYYRELLGNMQPCDVSDNVRYTLRQLKQDGYKVAIGSSSKNTKFILERVNLDGEFDAISDGTNIVNSKPDPEVFLKAAEFLDSNPVNCIVVEDSESGIDAAVAGGMVSAAIGDATNCGKADYCINRLSDLIGILGTQKYAESVG